MSVATSFDATGDNGSGEEARVPSLRQDLEILEGWPLHSGAPTWMLFDPLRNKYFRISNTNFQLLSSWSLGVISDIRQSAEQKINRVIEPDEIGDLIKFLLTNQLTSDPPEEGYRSFSKQEQASKRGVMGHLIHSYLFFRIPLFRPQRFLDASWPLVRPLFSFGAALFFCVLAVAGLYLVSRQWDAFQDQFLRFLSVEGLLLYGASLVLLKILHELGHAFMAVRYGLKVPVIGVAFLVLMPIMYTDTSDAWRLRSRRQRLMIDGAGVMTELCLAATATVFWVFLPDGALRSIAFSIATVSWLLSLLINLNPFMRFDGYYILSDVLGFENLQEREFALARWKMRETLFGLGLPPPETVDLKLRSFLILHAWGTWIYRFFLFLGIAFLIYSFFIKAVAIVLFAIEILWFILMPIYREARHWLSIRSNIVRRRRSWATFAIWAGALLVFFAPISGSVRVPAVLHSETELAVYPPASARVTKLVAVPGQAVSKGDILAVFSSDRIALETDLAGRRIELLQLRLARSNANPEDRANRCILLSQLESERKTLAGLLAQRDDLTLRAAEGGVVTDFNHSLHAGRTMPQSTMLFRIRKKQDVTLSGLLSESDVLRVKGNAFGTFYPDDLAYPSIPVRAIGMSTSTVSKLAYDEMSEMQGGHVPTVPDGRGGSTVAGSYYGIVLDPMSETERPHSEQTIRGVAHLDAERISLASMVFRRVASVLMRESGF